MTAGFGGDSNQNKLDKKIKIKLNLDYVDTILKKYKKINRYKRSSVYAVKQMEGTEEIINKLISETQEDSL
jgi:hypothetical protein